LELEPKYVAAINERYAALNKLIFEGDPSALLGVQIEQSSQENQFNQQNQDGATGLFEKMIMDNEDI
jgi:hypothetical protein